MAAASPPLRFAEPQGPRTLQRPARVTDCSRDSVIPHHLLRLLCLRASVLGLETRQCFHLVRHVLNPETLGFCVPSCRGSGAIAYICVTLPNCSVPQFFLRRPIYPRAIRLHKHRAFSYSSSLPQPLVSLVLACFRKGRENLFDIYLPASLLLKTDCT